MLEQEIASLIKYILNTAGNPSPYYYEVSEGFLVPSAYFPPPEIASNGGTLSTYTLSYTWFVKFFHKDTPLAHGVGLSVLTALQSNRNRVPLIAADGAETGKLFHIKDPSLKKIDGASGVSQLTLMWDSPRPYIDPQADKMAVYDLNMYTRSAYEDAVRGLTGENDTEQEDSNE